MCASFELFCVPLQVEMAEMGSCVKFSAHLAVLVAAGMWSSGQWALKSAPGHLPQFPFQINLHYLSDSSKCFLFQSTLDKALWNKQMSSFISRDLSPMRQTYTELWFRDRMETGPSAHWFHANHRSLVHTISMLSHFCFMHYTWG